MVQITLQGMESKHVLLVLRCCNTASVMQYCSAIDIHAVAASGFKVVLNRQILRIYLLSMYGSHASCATYIIIVSISTRTRQDL